MALAYQPPGVRFQEIVGPAVNPLLGAPITVALVGPAQGYIQRTDQIHLTGTTPVLIPGIPTDATLSSVLSVKDAVDPTKGAPDGSGYVVTTDYTISTANHTITRVASGGIADGATVNVSYQYLPSDYFTPIRLDEFGAIESRFGTAWDTTGTQVNSPLTYAAQLLWENGGGQSVVCVPLFSRLTPGDPTTAQQQPTPSQIANAITWQDTLFNLRAIEDVEVLVPIVGQSMSGVGDATQLGIIQTFQDHLVFMINDAQKYLITVFGEDSSLSSSVAQQATLTSHASTIQNRYGGVVTESMVMVSPSKFVRELPASNSTIYIGGQYAAAAVAGMLVARAPQEALTRQVVSGLVGVADKRTKQQMNADAGNGMLVLMENRGDVIVRHAITMDNTLVARRALNVVVAKHFMIASIKVTLEDQVIGKVPPPPDDGSIMTKSAVIGILELLKTNGDILAYANVGARALATDPTTIEVRFSYRPEFAIDYINVIFSIDLTLGAVTQQSTTASGSSNTAPVTVGG